MDSPPAATHPCGARCARLSAALRPRLNSLRGSIRRSKAMKKAATRAASFVVGGGGENGFAACGDSPLRGALRASVGRVAASVELAARFDTAVKGHEKSRHSGRLRSLLVEVARIELASASPTLRGLHAYTVFNLTAGYPTGRENLQPAQKGFNGLSPEHARAAVLCR